MAADYLSIEDVARCFGVNATTVYRLAQRGKLPAFKVGNQWRFSKAMLDEWVSEQAAAERARVPKRPRRGNPTQR